MEENIYELIERLCPEGVEYRRLGEVCEVQRGIRVVRKELNEKGPYPVYQNSLTPLGYSNEFNTQENTTFVISAGAAGQIGYSDGPFWAADDCVCIKGGNILLGRFIYYALSNNSNYFLSKVRKASVPRLAKTAVVAFEIPVPPMEVQQEVVRILDKFTALQAQLQAELQARKKQYEYYRDKLLTFSHDDPNVVWKKLGEVCEIKTGKGITQKDCSETYQYPVYSGGQSPMGFYNDYNREANTVTVSRVGAYAGFVNFVVERFYLNDKCFSVVPKTQNVILPKFLYYYVKSKEELIKSLQSEGGVPTINTSKLGSLDFPIPPLEKQKEIVEILDKFEALTTDLQRGLPAEIEARRKQYEYYRDKLLSFKRLVQGDCQSSWQ